MLNQILRLDRPLGILDLETTGLDPEKDRIVQIALTKHYPDREPIAWCSLINPECPITNKQHGITDEAIAEAPTFAQIAPALAPRMLNIDIGGYHVHFDIGFMKASMKRAGVDWPWEGHIIDALQIYKLKKGHTLTNAYQEFGGENGDPLPPGTEFEGAHDAGNDVRATEIVFRGQLQRFSNLPRTVKELAEFCFPHPENAVDTKGKFVWVGNDAAVNFGKWRGTLLKKMNRGYMHWAVNSDMDDEVKIIFQDALDGTYPTK